jgi:VWFA-related protein
MREKYIFERPFMSFSHPKNVYTKVRKRMAMKIPFCAAVVLLVLSSFAIAQSGRRVAPTPAPAVKTENPDSYSETKPMAARPPRVVPTMRASANDSLNTGSKPAAETPAAGIPVDDSEIAIKVDTNLITIPVSVFDRNGLYIPNIQQSEFKIFEDGIEQEIAYFGTTDKPFTVVLMLDTSPSTQYKIEQIHSAAKSFVEQLKPQDRVMVIEFNGSVKVRTEATNDRQTIYKAIEKADFGSGTSLYDAVDVALRKYLSAIEGRKAVVLFTDGVDTTSRKATYDSTLEYAEEMDALIFPIYYNTFLDNRGMNGGGTFPSSNWPSIGNVNVIGAGQSAAEYAVGRKYVQELADYTGGRLFRPESTPGGLEKAFEGIAEELRRQYSIGYIPKDDGKPGQRKQIKVRVNRANLVVRSRDSYIVGNGK